MKRVIKQYQILFVLAAAIALITACAPARPPAVTTTPTPAPTSAVAPAPTTALDPVASAKPVFVEFYATWGALCKQMKPTVSRLMDEYKERVDFKSYDTAGLSDDIRRKYQFVSQPQFVILDRRGKIAFNRFSYQSYESLKADLEAVLASPGRGLLDAGFDKP